MRGFPASNKQMRFLATFLLLPLLGAAAILPDDIGPYHRTATTQPALDDRPLWGEYGIKAWEAGTYQNGKDRLTATVWQLQDSTGALGAYDWRRAQQSTDTPSQAAPLAAETKDSLLLVHGNYLLQFEGYKPSKEELEAIYGTLKNVDNTALPVLTGYLPTRDLVPHSERYVIGPVGLERFDSGIPPSVAAFHFGAEAQIGVFQSPKGPVELAIFNYPTAQIAMQKVGDFQKLQGAMAKRSGPLVAVVLSPGDPDFAERLLGEVRYQAEVTRDEYVPTRRDNPGVLILNIFILIGILVLFALVSGFAFGGFRLLRRKARKGEEPEAMITLHLTR
jgi:hypothetical protein